MTDLVHVTAAGVASAPAPAASGVQPIDAAASAALEKLADVVSPPPPDWLPRTWGWAIVGLLLLMLLAWALRRWHRQRVANRYRREALAELARLQPRLAADDTAARAQALADAVELLKRVALAAFPRPQVAALNGPRWVAFLREHAGHARLDDASLRWIETAEYRTAPPSADEARALGRTVRQWIEAHRVPA